VSHLNLQTLLTNVAGSIYYRNISFISGIATFYLQGGKRPSENAGIRDRTDRSRNPNRQSETQQVCRHKLELQKRNLRV